MPFANILFEKSILTPEELARKIDEVSARFSRLQPNRACAEHIHPYARRRTNVEAVIGQIWTLATDASDPSPRTPHGAPPGSPDSAFDPAPMNVELLRHVQPQRRLAAAERPDARDPPDIAPPRQWYLNLIRCEGWPGTRVVTRKSVWPVIGLVNGGKP